MQVHGATNFMGNPATFESKNNATTITIDRTPVYLQLKALPAKNLAVLLKPEIKVAPVAPHMAGNVLPNGNFEDLNGDALLNWRMPGGDKVKLAAEAGNHYIVITPKETPFDPRIFANLPLEATWKTMRISARLKGVSLKPGKEAWQKATIIVRIMDKDNKELGYAPAPSLDGDTDWKIVTTEFSLPTGADHLAIEVAHFGSAGEFSIDDISFVPNAK
jgi:hypothetical protein